MTYDKIELSNTEAGVQVYINGADLITLLHTYEKPFTKKEGSPKLAGGYAPVPLSYFLSKSYSTDFDDDLALFDCECGVGGCWPMVVKVTKTEDAVVWSGFQQPFRDETSHSFWDYSDFGPFKFKASEYDKQLSKINK